MEALTKSTNMGIEEIQEQYEIGYKVLEKLSVLSDVELKKKLKSIIGSELDKCNDYILSDKSDVDREIHNEKHRKITISFYDWIEITPFGIYYHPEHGEGRRVVEFNKHFIL